jgi:hypothetical protein
MMTLRMDGILSELDTEHLDDVESTVTSIICLFPDEGNNPIVKQLFDHKFRKQ